MKKVIKRILIILAILIVIINLIIIAQGYGFTHFKKPSTRPLNSGTEITSWDKIKILFTGVEIERPIGHSVPTEAYKDIVISVDEHNKLYGWYITCDTLDKGTILLFHGYVDNKTALLPEAYEFKKLGYNTLLIDFMGSGESYGNRTTMGYLEAENVLATYNYAIDSLHEDNILFYGFSMGAAAVMKAQHDHQLDVSAIMLQAPYATFEGTVEARIKLMGLPLKPTSGLATFWIGLINGFDGFDANPIEHAAKIYPPTLLMTGGKDINIPATETKAIYDAIASKSKQLQLFEEANHESLFKKDSILWKKVVTGFIDTSTAN